MRVGENNLATKSQTFMANVLQILGEARVTVTIYMYVSVVNSSFHAEENCACCDVDRQILDFAF